MRWINGEFIGKKFLLWRVVRNSLCGSEFLSGSYVLQHSEKKGWTVHSLVPERIDRLAVNRRARQMTCVGPNTSIRHAVRLRIMTRKHRAMITLMTNTAFGVTQSNRTTYTHRNQTNLHTQTPRYFTRPDQLTTSTSWGNSPLKTCKHLCLLRIGLDWAVFYVPANTV